MDRHFQRSLAGGEIVGVNTIFARNIKAEKKPIMCYGIPCVFLNIPFILPDRLMVGLMVLVHVI